VFPSRGNCSVERALSCAAPSLQLEVDLTRDDDDVLTRPLIKTKTYTNININLNINIKLILIIILILISYTVCYIDDAMVRATAAPRLVPVIPGLLATGGDKLL